MISIKTNKNKRNIQISEFILNELINTPSLKTFFRMETIIDLKTHPIGIIKTEINK